MSRRKRRASRRNSSSQLRDNAIQAFRSGNYGIAIDCWERLRKRNSTLLQEAPLAEAYFRQGLNDIYDTPPKWEDCFLYFQEAAKLQPDEARYHYYSGLAAYQLGDLKTADAAYQKAHQLGGSAGSRAAYALALMMSEQGQAPIDHAIWADLTPEEQAMIAEVDNLQRRPYTLSEKAPPLWRGVVALDEDDLDKAQSELEKALAGAASQKTAGVTHYYLGVIAARREDLATASHHWHQAQAAGFDAPHLALNLGETYHRMTEAHLQANKAQEAAEAAREALRYKPGKRNLEMALSQAYQRLGYESASRGAWEEAQRHWDQAYELENGSFRLIYNLALAAEKRGDYIEAAESWRETLRRRPRSDDHADAMDDAQVAQLWQRAAEAYVKAGEYDEAVQVYRQAVKYNPDNLETRMALVDSLQDNGQFQAAINELDRILDANPDHIPALMRMGDVILNSGYWWRSSGALQYWEHVLELDPNHREARQALFDYWMNQADNYIYWNNGPMVEKSYQQALDYIPDHPEALTDLGNLYLQNDHEDLARDYFEKALAHGGQDPRTYHLIIASWLIEGYDEEAWDMLLRAEKTIPDKIESGFYTVVAGICIDDGGFERARPWLERAVERAKPDETPLHDIGVLFVQKQMYELASEYFQKSVDANQMLGPAHLSLGIIATMLHEPHKARLHWRKAERIAERDKDDDLLQHVRMMREMSAVAPELIEMVMSGAPLPFNLFDMLNNEEFIDDEFGW